MTINAIMVALVAELEAGEILTPLAERFTLAHVWADLARLAGEELPLEALAIVGPALDVAYEAGAARRLRRSRHAVCAR